MFASRMLVRSLTSAVAVNSLYKPAAAYTFGARSFSTSYPKFAEAQKAQSELSAYLNVDIYFQITISNLEDTNLFIFPK